MRIAVWRHTTRLEFTPHQSLGSGSVYNDKSMNKKCGQKRCTNEHRLGLASCAANAPSHTHLIAESCSSFVCVCVFFLGSNVFCVCCLCLATAFGGLADDWVAVCCCPKASLLENWFIWLKWGGDEGYVWIYKQTWNRFKGWHKYKQHFDEKKT